MRGPGHYVIRAVSLIEHGIKNVIFGCYNCGQCQLSYTGFTCPMRCTKQLRNGPCGGTRPGGWCESDPQKRCAWYLIVTRSEKLGRLDMLDDMRPVIDWRLVGTSAWINCFLGKTPWPVIFRRSKKKFA